MTVRIGINGFGRIGRNYVRAARSMGADVEVVAVNDLVTVATNAHLLKYDSTHGVLAQEVTAGDDAKMVVGPVTDTPTAGSTTLGVVVAPADSATKLTVAPVTNPVPLIEMAVPPDVDPEVPLKAEMLGATGE